MQPCDCTAHGGPRRRAPRPPPGAGGSGRSACPPPPGPGSSLGPPRPTLQAEGRPGVAGGRQRRALRRGGEDGWRAGGAAARPHTARCRSEAASTPCPSLTRGIGVGLEDAGHAGEEVGLHHGARGAAGRAGWRHSRRLQPPPCVGGRARACAAVPGVSESAPAQGSALQARPAAGSGVREAPAGLRRPTGLAPQSRHWQTCDGGLGAEAGGRSSANAGERRGHVGNSLLEFPAGLEEQWEGDQVLWAEACARWVGLCGARSPPRWSVHGEARAARLGIPSRFEVVLQSVPRALALLQAPADHVGRRNLHPVLGGRPAAARGHAGVRCVRIHPPGERPDIAAACHRSSFPPPPPAACLLGLLDQTQSDTRFLWRRALPRRRRSIRLASATPASSSAG